MTTEINFKLKGEPGALHPVNVELYIHDNTIQLYLGDGSSGEVVVIENRDGEPYVVIWSDLNQKSPTHTISLARSYRDKEDSEKKQALAEVVSDAVDIIEL